MGAWSWTNSLPLTECLRFFFVLFDPELIVCLVELDLWRYGMGTVIARPRDRITDFLSVHVEENSFTFRYLSLLEFGHFLIFLLY